MLGRPAPALLGLAVCFFLCTAAVAQTFPTDSSPPAPAPGGPSTAQDTGSKAPAELDQTIVNLQTTLPVKRHGSFFQITHRFARDLGRGDFSQLASELFSLDDAAIISLEYRFALTSRIQAAVHRSILGKTIAVFGRWDWWRQAEGRLFSLSVMPSLEGQNNLRLDPQPGIAAILSRSIGPQLMVYAQPSYVHNAHTATLRAAHGGHDVPGLDPEEHSNSTDTGFIGLGARLRIRPSVMLVGETSPRIGGYQPGPADWNAGIEKLTHGHVLQLNFGNNFNSTQGMTARGGIADQVFMGFNLSRKF
jgi:uncharacterized beta barrel domain-containing protein DUF5777